MSGYDHVTLVTVRHKRDGSFLAFGILVDIMVWQGSEGLGLMSMRHNGNGRSTRIEASERLSDWPYMKVWRCSCTIVRCATGLNAVCRKCRGLFQLASGDGSNDEAEGRRGIDRPP